MSELPVSIRPLATLDEFRRVSDVQSRAWSVTDPTELVPAHILLTAQKEGGLVAGAFTEQGEMVGYVFGFVGIASDGRFKHCSHMAGVVPEARGYDVGYRLKLFQRQYVQKQDLALITWTYDPLEGRNAMLNIAKLGGIAHKYYFNLYGEWNDGINRGLPTDRFEVEWWINSERVSSFVEAGRERPRLAAIRASGATQLLAAEFDANGVPHPVTIDSPSGDLPLILEVPADFQTVKIASMDLAAEWRRVTALLFTRLFGEGYIVYDYLSELEGDRRRNFYLLARNVPGLGEGSRAAQP